MENNENCKLCFVEDNQTQDQELEDDELDETPSRGFGKRIKDDKCFKSFSDYMFYTEKLKDDDQHFFKSSGSEIFTNSEGTREKCDCCGRDHEGLILIGYYTEYYYGDNIKKVNYYRYADYKEVICQICINCLNVKE